MHISLFRRHMGLNGGPDSSGKMRAKPRPGRARTLERYLTTERLLNLPRVTGARPRQDP